MTVDDAPARLKQLLAEEGTDAERPEPAAAWRAFKRFAAEPIAGLSAGSDRLLFEAIRTKYGPDGGPAISVDFERQITLEGDGEYEGMRHITCAFAYPADALPAGTAPALEWGAAADGSTAWAERVEASPYIELLGRDPTHASVEAGPI